MLTLDRITLFYHDLREEARAAQGDSDPDEHVTNWAAKVAVASTPGKAQSKGKGKARASCTTASLARSSKHTESSAVILSNRSTLDSNVGVKVVGEDYGETGGLSDHDETRGEEYEEARNSPVKGKVRLSSSVSWPIVFSLAPTHEVYRLWCR